MKTLIKNFLFLAMLAMCTSIFAGPSKGVGHGKSGVGSISTGGKPPGLQGKSYPHGLSNQIKVPYGWSKGKKVGWHKLQGKWYYFNGNQLIRKPKNP